MTRLKIENARLKEEVEILKKIRRYLSRSFRRYTWWSRNYRSNIESELG